MMRSPLLVLTLLAAGCGLSTVPAADGVDEAPRLEAQSSGTTALLQAVSVVDERVVWVSGQSATYARTTDGGNTWRAGVVRGDTALQFRDVHAVDSITAYLLAAGPGDRSRIYKTTNGGTTWRLQFTNQDSTAFFDCFAFWDASTGLAFSDASRGRFPVLRTTDGSRWTPVPSLPEPLANEGGFAASGTCVTTGAGGRAWIGTGNSAAARVLRTAIVSGEAAGITSVAFRDTSVGVALGGRITAPDERSDNVAFTRDGGRTWMLGGRPTFSGAIYGGVYVPDSRTLIAVGPEGASLSRDDGATWTAVDSASYWSVGFASPRAGWMVGPGGRITKVTLAR
jgi:photosystem II stability/assembly factor-like uncharacterized protein